MSIKIKLMILYLIVECSFSLAQPPMVFTAVHCDPNETENFPVLLRLVDSADAYQVHLTIEFTEPWAQIIREDTAKLRLLREWQEQGHEIAMHHHGLRAPYHWDGYSADTSQSTILAYGKDPADLKGDMNDFMEVMMPLGGDSSILTFGTGDTADWIEGIPYQNDGNLITHTGLPIEERIYGSTQVLRIGQFFLDDTNYAGLNKLIKMLNSYDSGKVVGAVFHVYNFKANPEIYMNWFRAIQPGHCRSVRAILSGYSGTLPDGVVYIQSEGIGTIAVRIDLPHQPRFSGGAPVVISVSTFFTPTHSFAAAIGLKDLGVIHLSYLWPGKEDQATGVKSDGDFDYGGPVCIQALRDVIRFALGQIPDWTGRYIGDGCSMPVLTDNVGLYAFSHPGIAAVNVMAEYGSQLQGLAWWIGRENPTLDILSCVEIGHWDDSDSRIPVYNPFYHYPESYSDTAIVLDYSGAGWIRNGVFPNGRPFFQHQSGTYILGNRIPQMVGKYYYSVNLLQALIRNHALDTLNWPESLCTLADAKRDWPYRSSVLKYDQIASDLPNLKIMQIFCRRDHVHPVADKPHIHQAYNGLRRNGLWVRLNPDPAYIGLFKPGWINHFPDHDANTAPIDWNQIGEWAYPDSVSASSLVPLAGILEMVDRTYYNEWKPNLERVLPDSGEVSIPDSVVCYIPSAVAGESGIAVQILFPSFPRLSSGSPLAIIIPGGSDGGSIGNKILDLPQWGITEIHFNFPGSVGPDSSCPSGGIYDDRGPLSIQSLVDVVRFAQGLIPDQTGKRISDYQPGLPLRYENLGLVGLSNGGNSALAAAGITAQEINPLQWLVNWESPVGDAMPTAEAGHRDPRDPPNPSINPAYSTGSGTFDSSLLRYSNAVFYLDNQRNHYDGGLYYDINRNNAPDLGTDFILTPYIHQNRFYVSEWATRQAFDQNLYPLSLPAHLTTQDETHEFWYWRNGEYWIDSVVAKNPQIMVIVVATAEDHVQTAPNHPHIVLQYNRLIQAGTRLVRLNPDRSYLEYIIGKPIPKAADNDAFASVTFDNVAGALEPSGNESFALNPTVVAAVCELIDRTANQNTSIQIEPGQTRLIISSQPGLEKSELQNYPNPFSRMTVFMFITSHPGPATLSFYSITGEQIDNYEFAHLAAGRYRFQWEARNGNGNPLPSGIYLCRLRTPDMTRVRTIMVLK
ncbi:MAG: hypothetical protein KBA26_05260 [Candidatus Delongbacteria bacterium]|nr:hypothetical protein [Candidatus Delongbacteria bacterium]